MWENDWNQLTERDKEQFGRLINLLLQRTFIIRDEIDIRTKNMVINRDYRFLERHFNLIKEYLQISGWEIQMDNHQGVAALYNRYGYNHKRIDKNTTYFLYILRLIYEEQQEKLSLRRSATTTLGAVVEKMFHLGLLNKKPSDKILRESLSILKSYSIIEKIEGPWTSPETPIIIYPSILFLVTNERINELYQRLSQLENGKDFLEEVDEDENPGENAAD